MGVVRKTAKVGKKVAKKVKKTTEKARKRGAQKPVVEERLSGSTISEVAAGRLGRSGT